MSGNHAVIHPPSWLALLLATVTTSVLGPDVKAQTAHQPALDLHGDPLPKGALVRLGTIRFRYHGRASHLQYSRDGKRLQVVANSWFYLFDSETGERLRREDLHGQFWLQPSDDVLMLGRQGYSDPLARWKITDPKSFPPRVQRQPHGMIQTFAVDAGPQGDHPRLGNFTLSPDGKTLATAVNGRLNLPRKVQLWQFDPEKSLREQEPLGPEWTAPSAVQRLVFSSDGQRLVVVTEADQGRNIMVCEKQKPDDVITLSVPDPAMLNSRGFAVSADCQRIAVGTKDRRLLLYQVDPPKLQHTIAVAKTNHPITVLSYSPDGSKLAGGGQGKTIWIWDVHTGQLEKQLPAQHSWIENLSFSPDGNTLAAAGQDGVIRLWDVAEGTRKRGPDGHDYWAFGASFSGDGNLAATCGADGTTRLWDAATGKQVQVIRGSAGQWVTSCRLAPRGAKLGLTASQRIALHDTKTGKEIWSEKLAKPVGVASDSLSFSADGARMSAITGRKHVTVWEPLGRGVVAKIAAQSSAPQNQKPGANARNHEREVQCARLSPDGLRLAVGTKSRMAASSMIELWDVETQQQLMLLIPEKGGVSDLRFSPDGRWLASAGHCSRQGWVDGDRDIGSTDLEDSLILWDLETGNPVRKFPAFGKDGRRVAYGVAFSPDGKFLVSAERSAKLMVYETATGELLKEVEGHEGEVQTVTFSSDGKRLLSVSHDHTGLIWDFPALLADED